MRLDASLSASQLELRPGALKTGSQAFLHRVPVQLFPKCLQTISRQGLLSIRSGQERYPGPWGFLQGSTESIEIYSD